MCPNKKKQQKNIMHNKNIRSHAFQQTDAVYLKIVSVTDKKCLNNK